LVILAWFRRVNVTDIVGTTVPGGFSPFQIFGSPPAFEIGLNWRRLPARVPIRPEI